MAAQFVDALKGYEYYIEKRGKATIEDVNEYLEKVSHNHISERMYGHYKKLMAQGFRSYLPINQFDVSRTLGKLQMLADRRRYNREPARLKSWISSDRSNWVQAKIINQSLVGFGMETSSKLPIKRRNLFWVRINHYRDIPSILVWAKHEENKTKFGVRCIEFIAKYKVSREEIFFERPTGLLIVRKGSNGDLTWREFYRILSNINQLIDASSTLIYSVAEIIKKDIKLASPFLTEIRFSSPVNIKMKVDLDVAKVAKAALEKAQLWKEEKERYRVETRKMEQNNKVDIERKEIENSLLKIECIRNAVRFRTEAIESGINEEVANNLFVGVLLETFRVKIPANIFQEGSLELGIITERLLPAAAELEAGDDPDIEVSIETQADHHSNDENYA